MEQMLIRLYETQPIDCSALFVNWGCVTIPCVVFKFNGVVATFRPWLGRALGFNCRTQPKIIDLGLSKISGVELSLASTRNRFVRILL